jgi:hypothetical protein
MPQGQVDVLANAFIAYVCQRAYEVFKADPDASYGSRLGALKWGALFRPGSSYEFQSFTYSPGQRDINSTKGDSHIAEFVTGSVLVPVHGSRAGPTGRIGAGVVCGDPSRKVYGLGVATYLSPSAVDFEMSFSLRLGANEESPDGLWTTPDRLDRATRPRLLLDHIRAGDLWFAGGARWIANPSSSSLAAGQIFEAALTYALPKQSRALGTTLTVSHMYSAQDAFAVDKYGFEIRTPVVHREEDAEPVVFSARYGTRGHWTFAFEGRF